MSVSLVGPSVRDYSLPEEPSASSSAAAASSPNGAVAAEEQQRKTHPLGMRYAQAMSIPPNIPTQQTITLAQSSAVSPSTGQSQANATGDVKTGPYDIGRQPELATRYALVTRLFGDTDEGGQIKGLDEQYGAKVAELASRGNPYQRAVLASVFGGPDASTGKALAPAWERVGMSRAEFKRKLIEAPWEITNQQLAKSGAKRITEQDYNNLQSIHGPLGYLLGMGVEPKTALGIQETWGRSFYGGVDRQGHASQPVWERWNHTTPQAMQQMFVNDLFAQSQFARLTGGADPLQSGKTLDAPYGNLPPQRYAQSLLSQAEDTLGVRAAAVPTDFLGVAQKDLHVLSFTAISSREMLGLVQSPHVRNDATKLGDPGKTGAIVNTSLPPGEAYPGLFGYVRVTAPEGPQPGWREALQKGWGEALQTGWRKALQDLLGPGNGVQLHGMYYPISQNGEWVGHGGFAKLQFLPPEATEPNAQGETKSDPSAFFKFIGQVTPDASKLNFFLGATDESKGSRGRSPGFLFVESVTNLDGTRDHFKVSFGGPALNAFASRETLERLNLAPGKGGHAVGPTIEFRQVNGEWRPSLDGFVVEGGQMRWQFYANASRDPITKQRDGFSLMFGTGHALIGAGVRLDKNNPTLTVFPSRGEGARHGFDAYVSYQNPEKLGGSLAIFGGLQSMKGVSGGASAAFERMKDMEVFVVMPDNALSETAVAVAKDIHGKLDTLTYQTLPEGVAVAASTSRDQSLQVMGLVKYYALPTIAGGWGGGERFEVLRSSANTWVVSRFTDSRSNFSVSLGSFGVGAAGLRYDNDRAGESFRFDGHNAQMTEAQREAMLLYQRDGILPGALQLDQGKHRPADLNAYRTTRDSVNYYNKLLHEFLNLKEGNAAFDEFLRNSNDAFLKNHIPKKYVDGGRGYIYAARVDAANYLNTRHSAAVEQLTQMYRDTIKPGMEVMDGVTLDRRVVSDTESHRVSVVSPIYKRDFGHRNSADPQGTTFGYSNIKETGFWPFYSDTAHTSLDWRANAHSPEENRARLAVSGELPLADIHAAGIQVGGDSYVQQAVEQGRMKQPVTTLSFALGDADITALGKDLLQGESGQRLWNSYRDRTLTLLEGRTLTMKDIRDYASPGESLANLQTKLDAVVGGIFQAHPVNKAALTDFVRTMTPEKFSAADTNTQEAVFKLVLATSSGAHSRFETLGLTSRVENAEQRLKMFAHIVEDAATAPLHIEPNPEYAEADRFNWAQNSRGTSIQTPREGHFTHAEPTLEFMRFVKSQLQDQELAKTILSQGGAQQHLPEVVTRHSTDSPEKLASLLRSVAESKSNGQDAAGALVAAAQRSGTPGAWRFLHENKIDPRYLLSALGRSGEDQILRKMVVDILEPGTPQFAPGMGQFFADERKAAEELFTHPTAAYPRSPAHTLEHARGELAVKTREGNIASSNVHTQINPIVAETASVLRNVALTKYGAAVERMLKTGQANQLNRQDALAYAAHLYRTHQLNQYSDVGAMNQAVSNAAGPDATSFLQQHNVSLSDSAQAEARKQGSSPIGFPLNSFIAYQNDALAQITAAIAMERAQPALPSQVPAANAEAYRNLIAAPREEFLAQHATRSARLREGLIAYAHSVQTYVRENGAADLSDMDLRALIVGGPTQPQGLDLLYGAQAQSVNDRLAKDGYTQQDLMRLSRVPKELDIGSKQHDAVAAQLTTAAAQFVASGNAFSTTRATPGSLTPKSVTDIQVGGGQHAYRTTFSVGTEGATLVQLLPRGGATAADARTLNPEGEHFLLDKNGELKLWTRREPGTGKLYVIHHNGKDPLSATPSGVLNVRSTSWVAVRDALLRGDLRGLAMTPDNSRKGDLHYSELQSSWTTYDPKSGNWVDRFADLPEVEPMLFAVRSPNEMYVQR